MNCTWLSEQERDVLRVLNRMKRIPIPRLYTNLSPAEADLMEIVLKEGNGLTVSAIAEAMELPMPAVSRLLRGLEERKLIIRSVLPQDRRSVAVTVTAEGERMLREMCECIHTFLRASLENVDREKFNQMIREWDLLLDRMEEVFRTYQKSPGVPECESSRALMDADPAEASAERLDAPFQGGCIQGKKGEGTE